MMRQCRPLLWFPILVYQIQTAAPLNYGFQSPPPLPLFPALCLFWHGTLISDIFFCGAFILFHVYWTFNETARSFPKLKTSHRHNYSKRQLYLVQRSVLTLWVDLLIINLLLVFPSFHIWCFFFFLSQRSGRFYILQPLSKQYGLEIMIFSVVIKTYI